MDNLLQKIIFPSQTFVSGTYVTEHQQVSESVSKSDENGNNQNIVSIKTVQVREGGGVDP